MTKQKQEQVLPGLRLLLGEPRVVSEGVGYQWFPIIATFPDGQVIVTHNLAADSASLLVNGWGVHVSPDQGETWPLRYDVVASPIVRVPQPDGAVAGPSFRVYRDPAESPRRFRQHYTRFEAGGRRHVIEPWAVVIEGFPRDVQMNAAAPQQGQLMQARLTMHGDVIDLGGEMLTTAYLRFENDERYSTVAVVSKDGGRTWRYKSTVAGSDAVPEAKQGPCEAAMISLANGDLMCVMRTGGGSDQLLCRTYSSDGGKTWSDVDRLPAFSVAPSLHRLHNGVIVLATGRPGIDLWFSTDPRGQDWHRIDLVTHHNAQFPDSGHTIVPERSNDRAKRAAADQTTAYTSMIEVSPNRLLLVYDRVPFGWNPVPADSTERGRIYILPLEVERS